MSYCVSWWSGPDQMLPDPRKIGEMGWIAVSHAMFREAMESLYRSLPGKPATPADDPADTDWFKELERSYEKRVLVGEIVQYALTSMSYPKFWHIEIKVQPVPLTVAARLDVFLKVGNGVWQIDESEAIAQQVRFGQ